MGASTVCPPACTGTWTVAGHFRFPNDDGGTTVKPTPSFRDTRQVNARFGMTFGLPLLVLQTSGYVAVRPPPGPVGLPPAARREKQIFWNTKFAPRPNCVGCFPSAAGFT